MTAPSSRSIARDAVRAELERISLTLVLQRGFDAVTLRDLAEAAGVSRSTFLRHVGSKDDAVLGGLAAIGTQLADALRERPAGEGVWVSLRRAMDVVTGSPLQGDTRAFTVVTLIHTDSGLTRARWQPLLDWRVLLGAVLIERDPTLSAVAAQAQAGSALTCLDTATAAWVADGGAGTLAARLDEAFAAVQALRT